MVLWFFCHVWNHFDALDQLLSCLCNCTVIDSGSRLILVCLRTGKRFFLWRAVIGDDMSRIWGLWWIKSQWSEELYNNNRKVQFYGYIPLCSQHWNLKLHKPNQSWIFTSPPSFHSHFWKIYIEYIYSQKKQRRKLQRYALSLPLFCLNGCLWE